MKATVTVTFQSAGQEGATKVAFWEMNEQPGKVPVMSIGFPELRLPDGTKLTVSSTWTPDNNLFSIRIWRDKEPVAEASASWHFGSPTLGFNVASGYLMFYFERERTPDEENQKKRRPLRPMPQGWDKTIGDLIKECEEGKRVTISAEEAEWAFEYEVSSLPAGLTIPRDGEIWEAVSDCPIRYLALFATPGSQSGKATIPSGEKVRIVGSHRPKPLDVDFRPLRYDELHERLIPAEIRETPRYGGYSLSVAITTFNEQFRRVHDS